MGTYLSFYSNVLNRQNALNFPSLAYKRHCADMLMVYNILHGNVNLQSELAIFCQNLSSVTRGHDFKLFKPPMHKDMLEIIVFL